MLPFCNTHQHTHAHFFCISKCENHFLPVLFSRRSRLTARLAHLHEYVLLTPSQARIHTPPLCRSARTHQHHQQGNSHSKKKTRLTRFLWVGEEGKKRRERKTRRSWNFIEFLEPEKKDHTHERVCQTHTHAVRTHSQAHARRESGITAGSERARNDGDRRGRRRRRTTARNSLHLLDSPTMTEFHLELERVGEPVGFFDSVAMRREREREGVFDGSSALYRVVARKGTVNADV